MAAAADSRLLNRRIEAVRGFNRFYTRRIGVLREGLAGTRFPLAEARVLYELAHRRQPAAAELGRELGLDAGYLSRILRRFGQRGWVAKAHAPDDGRRSLLSLTRRGRAAFAPLNARSQAEVGELLGRLEAPDQQRLIEAMRTIQRLLGEPAAAPAPVVLRGHRPGDMGWVIQRHGALYALEYGWDETFEALVAHIAARFIERLDPRRERCWIAEQEGEPVGCVFLVRQSDPVAKLRLLLVEPKARGLGLGVRLVDECVRFARHAGYRKVTLWTNSVLVAARGIYDRAGFKLVHAEPHFSFGKRLVGEHWELKLR